MSDRTERPRQVRPLAHVRVGELESRPPAQVPDVLGPAGRQVIDADDGVAPGHEGIAQMRAEK
jgi:hypothetical protein